MSWTEQEIKTLKNFAAQNKYFYSEIALKMGKKVALVRHQARRLKLPSTQKTLKGRMGQWNCKHAHLREKLLVYYLTHTEAECKKHFDLTDSEFKSCLTRAYIDPEFRFIRKDSRNHDAWSSRELKFLLRHAGLKPRKWIASKLKRGNYICIKERLQVLGISSRTLQGITLSQFRQAFGKDPEFYLQTSAGPSRASVSAPTLWKIVPWTWLDQELKAKRLSAPKMFKQLCGTMALFQEWVFEGNAIKKMKRIVRVNV